MTVPMSEELREAVRKLRPKLGARTDAAAVRIAVAQLCREHGISVRGDEEHPDPDDQPEAPASPEPKGAKRPARKPGR